MDLGAVHVVAASLALGLGLAILARHKGGATHIRLGRLYIATMIAVGVPALFVYEITGGPGAFHVLAVISLATTTLGWLSARSRAAGDDRGVVAHATFMTWSWIGVVTAGLAQLANSQWPDRSPLPVLIVVGVVTAVGAVGVPRFVSRELRRRAHTSY